MADIFDFAAVENNIGYKFKDKSLLKRALTLASAGGENNQTLEFFGDAILEFLVSERIYSEKSSEGELTERRKAIVSDRALTPVSLKLQLDKHFIKSSGDGANKKAVPSAYEAVVAAIYLDGGIDKAREFVFSTLDFSGIAAEENYKGRLQELLQGGGYPCPVYERHDTGTPQKPDFRVAVELFGRTYEGSANNIRQAEQLAAKAALEGLEKNRNL